MNPPWGLILGSFNLKKIKNTKFNVKKNNFHMLSMYGIEGPFCNFFFF